MSDDRIPPEPQRVARRALVLTAVSHRALMELEAPPEIFAERSGSPLAWLTAVGADGELEEAERAFLQPGKTADPQLLINGVWRIEGLGVLAWALGLAELAAPDALVSPPELWERMGLGDKQPAEQLVANATLKTEEELWGLRAQLLALHWRLRDFRQIKREPMDFVTFSEEAWFGGFDIGGFTVIDGDLALGGRAIVDADPELVDRTGSAAMERHLAINWLLGENPVYSETDTST